MSDTSTITATESSLSASSILSTSLGPISSPRRPRSELSNAYKQGSKYYVTRRFRDALSTIKPLVEIPKTDNYGREDEYETTQAPIARAERKWRIKIWSFYLTLLNDIADLGREDGEASFGKAEWRSIANKLEDGSIWQEVVDSGYGGNEARVDGEVVINLANVLLSQSPNQRKNQQRLETYLSAPNIADTETERPPARLSSGSGYPERDLKYGSGTDTPRDLETRIQIIELFALYVLPHNGEWEYATEFIQLNEMLDADRKEDFLQIICELQEEGLDGQDQDEDAVPLQDTLSEKVVRSGNIERIDSNVTIKAIPRKMHRRLSSEHDYGIEETQPKPKSPPLQAIPPKPSDDSGPRPIRKPSGNLQSRPSRPPPSKPSRDIPQSTILKRSIALLSTIHKLLSNMTFHMSQNPAVLLRFVLFLMALIAAFGRRDLRERMRRIAGSGYDKVRNTVGMGFKVSYI